MTPLLVIIATCARQEMLTRTLQTLADSRLPASLRGVIVVENGKASGAEDVVKAFADRLPMRYAFTDAANKSRALNVALRLASDEFVVFFDDDVRVHPDTLQAYAREAGDHKGGFFVAGQCLTDRVEEPPKWLEPYLPSCAMGWSLGDSRQPVLSPAALGFNWGAFAADMVAVGGYDERRGPGTLALGDETELQQRFLKRGIRGIYAPDAIVWHYVPKERCNPEWCVSRKQRVAFGSGIELREAPAGARISKSMVAAVKLLGMQSVLQMCGPRLDAARRFHYQYWSAHYRGLLLGARNRSQQPNEMPLAGPAFATRLRPGTRSPSKET